GADMWNAYELSGLNRKGKPQVALPTSIVPADTPNIVASKSFKPHLNSLTPTRLASFDAMAQRLPQDPSPAWRRPVQVRLALPEQFGTLKMRERDGLLLDRLDIDTDIYSPAPELLHANHDETIVEETLVSHLLKSNCLVTGQPDWGSVQIRYVGAPIDQ